jgi:hypothetical protein
MLAGLKKASEQLIRNPQAFATAAGICPPASIWMARFLVDMLGERRFMLGEPLRPDLGSACGVAPAALS